MNTILLVEDHPHILKINHTALMMEGYRVLDAPTAFDCMELLKTNDVDLIILDIMLPDGDGISLCSEIKQKYHLPILFLSALGDNQNIIAGLRAGGDDYLPKPYDIDVLLARVEARLRSARQQQELGLIRFGNLKLDTISRIAFFQNQELFLTQKEFSLLLQLIRNSGQVLSKDTLYESVWGRPLSGDSSALYTTVSRLNAKLQEAHADLIISFLRGKGYLLDQI